MFGMKFMICCLICIYTSLGLASQSADSWYKVYTGKVGNSFATIHLHKAGNNYSGYIWFEQNQMPMQVYDGYPMPKTDSFMISSGSNNISFLMTGVFTSTGFKGVSYLEKEGNPTRKANFQLQVNDEKKFSPFTYFYAAGKDSLPPAYKNYSQIDYFSSSVWPTETKTPSASLKNFIRQQLKIKNAAVETGKWITDEKNNLLKAWKSSNTKLSPKETAEMGLSLSHHQEEKILVMHEDEKLITLAHYGFLEAGGAIHGEFGTTVATFNKLSGKQLQLTDVLNADGIKLMPIILEQVARIIYGIKNNKPLDENGFLVKKIELTKNIYVTGSGIGFLYAPYEIKPFSDGEVNLLVPFTALKSYLLPAFQ